MHTKKLIDKKNKCSAAILAIALIIILVALIIAFGKLAEARTEKDNAREIETLCSDYNATFATYDYKPIQKTFTVNEDDGTSTTYTVNFLPAFTDASWDGANLGFYKKNDDETYTELSKASGISITSMSTLATAIKRIGPDKVYTDTTNAKYSTTFYGTIDRAWNKTFNHDTTSGASKGLNVNFAESLTKAKLNTVYFEDNTSTSALSDWNWDHNEYFNSPTLNGIYYGTSYDNISEFYGAYRDLLSSYVYFPWSSSAHDDDGAFTWYCRNNNWISNDRNNDAAVVLSQDFNSKAFEIDSSSLAKNALYNGSAQIGVATSVAYELTEPSTEASIDASGNAVAINAGDYSVKATPKSGYAWKGGSTDTRTIDWRVDKAINPAVFVLDPSSKALSSFYSKDQSELRPFTAVACAPEDSTITYDASSSEGFEDNFYIPGDKTSNTLVCAEDTSAGVYTIKLGSVIQKC